MKEGIHPKAEKTTVACACGASYEIISTKKNVRVEICANCHPFYTGTQRQTTIGGRIERFKKKYGR